MILVRSLVGYIIIGNQMRGRKKDIHVVVDEPNSQYKFATNNNQQLLVQQTTEQNALCKRNVQSEEWRPKNCGGEPTRIYLGN